MTVVICMNLLLLSLTGVYAQKPVESKFVVTGIVKDAHSGKPVAAAKVSVKSENLSAITDDAGKFSLSLSSSTDVFEINALIIILLKCL